METTKDSLSMIFLQIVVVFVFIDGFCDSPWHHYVSLDDTNLNHAGKALVDLSRIQMTAMIDVGQIHIHRPLVI
jgi:hypothetical protein